MEKKKFTGHSPNGNINEAIINAIQQAKENLMTDYVEWELGNVRGKNGGFLLVNELEVTIEAMPPKSELIEQEISEALFVCMDAAQVPFIIKLEDQEKIIHARKILRGQEHQRVHIQGTVVKESADYNPGWSFHVHPASIDFFEMAIEVCDATVSYVEKNLDDVGGAFLPNNHWCPWTSKLVREV